MENHNHELVLVHHGTKGMKWGVRRYQNKDGTLTPAGKKRYNKEMAKLKEEERVLKNRQKTQAKFDKLEEKRKANADLKRSLDGKSETKAPKTPLKQPKPARKSAKDMTDDELKDVVTRLSFEKKYNELTPVQKSKGKAFVEGMWDKAVQPALQNVARSQLEKVLNDAISNTDKKK